jgi:hypothetical protein
MFDRVLKEFSFQYPFWCPSQTSTSLSHCVTTQSEWCYTSLRDSRNSKTCPGVETPGYFHTFLRNNREIRRLPVFQWHSRFDTPKPHPRLVRRFISHTANSPLASLAGRGLQNHVSARCNGVQEPASSGTPHANACNQSR